MQFLFWLTIAKYNEMFGSCRNLIDYRFDSTAFTMTSDDLLSTRHSIFE